MTRASLQRRTRGVDATDGVSDRRTIALVAPRTAQSKRVPRASTSVDRQEQTTRDNATAGLAFVTHLWKNRRPGNRRRSPGDRTQGIGRTAELRRVWAALSQY